MPRTFVDVKRIISMNRSLANADASEIRANWYPAGEPDIKTQITCDIGVKVTTPAYC
jgi:hypothetical protein